MFLLEPLPTERSSGSTKWEYKIFSARVKGWLFKTRLTVAKLLRSLPYGGVLDS